MIAGLILAGGTGTRLGGVDKALLRLHGKSLIEHLLPRLTSQIPTIAVSANGDAKRFAALGLPVLPDGGFAGKGPLAGLAAGLQWAKTLGADSLLTIPVDTPFIPTNLLARLTPAPAVALWQGRQHHLVALWPVTILPQLLDVLHAPGAYKVRDILALCQARPVTFDTPEDPFQNINTPEDLMSAQER